VVITIEPHFRDQVARNRAGWLRIVTLLSGNTGGGGLACGVVSTIGGRIIAWDNHGQS